MVPAAAEDARKPVVLPPIEADAKHPKRVNLKLMSKDPSYGYTKENPVKLGSKDENRGPRSEREFLDSLLDASGEPVSYSRVGNVGAGEDGHIIDLYEVTVSDGKKVRLYIDMYHPENKPAKQPAPVGFYKRR